MEEVLRSDTEIFALSRRLRATPSDGPLRLDYARVLSRSGNLRGAAASSTRCSPWTESSDEVRAEAELDRWVWLLRGGGEPGVSDVRKGLDKWVKKRGKHHERRAEGLYFLALAEERDSKAKDARKRYAEILKVRPASWFAEEARNRLAAQGT